MSGTHSHPVRPAGPSSVTTRRGRVALLAVLLPVLAATLVGLVALWPGEVRPSRDAADVVPDELVPASVVATRESVCGGAEEASAPACLLVTFRLEGGAGEQVLEIDPGSGQPRLQTGDDVTLALYVDTVGTRTYAFVDHRRGVPLLLLGLVTAAFVVLLARWRGVAALAGVGLTAVGVVAFVVPAVLAGSPPVLVALVACSALLYVVLYLAHGLSGRTSAALVGTLGGMALCAAASHVAVGLTRVTGLADESAVAVQAFAGQVDLRELLLCGFVIGSLGVLNDVTITQASAVWELRAADPSASRRAVYARAMRIGRDHVASSVYTLVFAYAGAALPLMLVFALLDRPLTGVLTGDLVAVELVRTAVGTLALLAAVPLTTAVAAAIAVPSGSDPGRDGQAGLAKTTTLST